MRKLLLSALSLALLGGMVYANDDADPAPAPRREKREHAVMATRDNFENTMISGKRWIGGHPFKAGGAAVLAVALYLYGPRGVLAMAKGINSWWCGCPKDVEQCDEVEASDAQQVS